MDREKPFPCKIPSCPQSFTTEDHLAVHLKTHEMMLNLPGKGCFIIDKTPTPSRLIRNLEEVGLFEENIFDVTFRKAIEEKHEYPSSSSSSLRRTISIQNEDTLHTPHIPLHLYKPEEVTSSNSESIGELIVVDDPIVAPTPPSKVAKQQPKRSPRKRPPGRRKIPLDELLRPKVELITPDTPPISIDFPDAIRIQPKCTVMLQYPAYHHHQQETTPPTPLSVRDRLRALLVKNDSSQLQTVTLTPPTPCQIRAAVGKSEPALPVLNVFSGEKKEEAAASAPAPSPDKVAIAKCVRPFSNSERNLAAAKRYRSRKKELFDGVLKRNRMLEEENRKLKGENQALLERLKRMEKEEAMREGGRELTEVY